MASLWMGDIDENMNEAFISKAFQSMGESVLGVKIIRNRFTGELSGYCFVEFSSQVAATRCLLNVNGKLVPGANPPKRFKLKQALYTKPTELSAGNPSTEYMTAFNYYTEQFNQMFTNWKYDQKSNSYTYQQYGYTENSWPTSEELEEEDLEDPHSQVDVAEANRQFMEQSEELYDALMSCRWQPLDTATSKVPYGS